MRSRPTTTRNGQLVGLNPLPALRHQAHQPRGHEWPERLVEELPFLFFLLFYFIWLAQETAGERKGSEALIPPRRVCPENISPNHVWVHPRSWTYQEPCSWPGERIHEPSSSFWRVVERESLGDEVGGRPPDCGSRSTGLMKVGPPGPVISVDRSAHASSPVPPLWANFSADSGNR